MSKTMVITDTCSDLPLGLVDNYDVEVLATTFNIDERFFSEGIDFSHENFYEILPAPKGKIKNFYIPAAVFLDRYKNAATCGFDSIAVILAGVADFPMHKSAKEAITLFREQNPTADIKIEVIDTENYSMSAGFLVLKAAKLAASGTDFDTIIEVLKESKDKMILMVDAFNIPFSYNDPTKGWRKWISFGGGYHPYPALKITTKKAEELPIIKGDHSAFDQFYTYCAAALSEKKQDYAIGYATRIKEAKAIAMLLEEELGYPPVALYKLGAVSAYGASKAALALCYEE